MLIVQLISIAQNAIKAVPRYAKEQAPEIAGYLAVTATITAATLKCFGKSKAAAVFLIANAAFMCKDKICQLYKMCQNPRTLALGVTAFALPYLGIFAMPAAAVLSFSFFKQQMDQQATIYRLEQVIADLKRNGESLNERLKAYAELSGSLDELTNGQIEHNQDLTTLLENIKLNTGRLEALAEKEEGVGPSLSKVLKQMCTLMEQIEIQNVAQDGAEVRKVVERMEAVQNQFPALEATIEETNERMTQDNQRLESLEDRLENVISILEQQHVQYPTGGAE